MHNTYNSQESDSDTEPNTEPELQADTNSIISPLTQSEHEHYLMLPRSSEVNNNDNTDSLESTA